MARFLIVVLPLASHLYPTLAIGEALVRGGHEVAWCGPESDLRPLVGTGAPIYPTGKRSYRRYAETGMAAVRVLWEGYLLPLTRFLLEPVDRAVADYRPDVVVADQYALAGGLVAHRRGVPWATVCTGAMELTPPDLPGLADFVRERLARAATMAGLPDGAPVDPRFSPHLVIALTTAALTGAAPLPERCVLTGPALGARPDTPGFAWDAWVPARRHVIVTVGTSSEHMAGDFYARMATALAPMAGEVQAVFVASGDAPAGNVITAERVPMLELLTRSDAVVCHAGMGTVTEALAHGVPLVLAPMRHDQPVVARQVTAAGAGVEVSMAAATPAELAAAVRAVLDEPGYRRHARRIAAEFAAAGGAAAAAGHLATRASGFDPS